MPSSGKGPYFSCERQPPVPGRQVMGSKLTGLSNGIFRNILYCGGNGGHGHFHEEPTNIRARMTAHLVYISVFVLPKI